MSNSSSDNNNDDAAGTFLLEKKDLFILFFYALKFSLQNKNNPSIGDLLSKYYRAFSNEQLEQFIVEIEKEFLVNGNNLDSALIKVSLRNKKSWVRIIKDLKSIVEKEDTQEMMI